MVELLPVAIGDSLRYLEHLRICVELELAI